MFRVLYFNARYDGDLQTFLNLNIAKDEVIVSSSYVGAVITSDDSYTATIAGHFVIAKAASGSTVKASV